MRHIVRLVTPLAASCLALGTLGAQSARITVVPGRPAPGALVGVLLLVDRAPADSIVAVSGTMAGEPLHFARTRTA